MICAPLTKAISLEKLYAALDTNFWDPKQPIESQLKKPAKHNQIRKTTNEPNGDVAGELQDRVSEDRHINTDVEEHEAIYEGDCEEVPEQANNDTETGMIEAHAKAAPRVYVETDSRNLLQNTDFSRGKLRPRAKEMLRFSTARESSG